MPYTRVVLLTLLALVAFAPAASAHACAEANCAAVAVVGEAVSDQDQGCIDCGPACANGCCHAPHPAYRSAPILIQTPAHTAARHAWRQSPEPTPVDTAGPDRPPRAAGRNTVKC